MYLVKRWVVLGKARLQRSRHPAPSPKLPWKIDHGLAEPPQIWASLVTLTALEIVLSIDNLVFPTFFAAPLPVAVESLNQLASRRRRRPTPGPTPRVGRRKIECA